LPHLQSLIIVLLKAIVAIASFAAAPPPSAQPLGMLGGPSFATRMNGTGPNGVNPKFEPPSPTDNDLDETRNREIAAKAVTGILVLMLKWLKLSREASPGICLVFLMLTR